MVNIMNAIIEKKVQFRIDSLSTRVSSDHLLAFQEELHALQRQLLKIKLSCRELIMATFTGEQWENFAFVVADNPKLASLLSRVNTIDAQRAESPLLEHMEGGNRENSEVDDSRGKLPCIVTHSIRRASRRYSGASHGA
jgi:hypothetical protein